jgi:hypothetical protein
MNLTSLQRECLETMGVDVYVNRSSPSFYWIGLEKPLTDETKALLLKMIAAMNWAIDKCIIEENIENLFQRKDLPKKGMIFSDQILPAIENTLHLPSLEVLQNNVDAKRNAWYKMQILIEKVMS